MFDAPVTMEDLEDTYYQGSRQCLWPCPHWEQWCYPDRAAVAAAAAAAKICVVVHDPNTDVF